MKYAVKKSDGTYRTTLYNELNQNIIDFHAERNETLEPVQGLDIEWDEEGEAISIIPIPLSVEQWRNSTTLSRRRFKVGEEFFLVDGVPLRDRIETLLGQLEGNQKKIATIEYEQATEFDRMNDFVVQFGQALGMSDEQVDEFFQFCLDESWKQ